MEEEGQKSETLVPENSDAPEAAQGDNSVKPDPEQQPETTESGDTTAVVDENPKPDAEIEGQQEALSGETKEENKQEVTADDNTTVETRDEQKKEGISKENGDSTADKAEVQKNNENPSERATPQCLITAKEPTPPEAEPTTLPESITETSTDKPTESSTVIPPDAPTETISDTNPTPEPSPEPQSKLGKSPDLSHDHVQLDPTTPTQPQPISVVHRSAHPSRTGIHTSLSLNQMAIAASAQNKLPISRLKGILERVSRHTESSAKKRGNWYKSETSYVDVNSYSWKNLSLYKDYQQHMWTGDGAIKSTCKK